jgi:hypothetical protein
MVVGAIVTPLFAICAFASNLENGLLFVALIVPPLVVYFEVAWRFSFHASLYDDWLSIRDGKASYLISYDRIEGIQLEGDHIELGYRGHWLWWPAHKRKTFRIERGTEFVEEIQRRMEGQKVEEAAEIPR